MGFENEYVIHHVGTGKYLRVEKARAQWGVLAKATRFRSSNQALLVRLFFILKSADFCNDNLMGRIVIKEIIKPKEYRLMPEGEMLVCV